MDNETHRWIESGGGPLIGIPESALGVWRGAQDSGELGDYSRACAVGDYVGVVDVGGKDALVLGEEPGPTTFVSAHHLFFRVIASDVDDDELVRLIDLNKLEVSWSDGPICRVSDAIRLLDAAADTRSMQNEDSLRIEIAPGFYATRSAYFEFGDIASIVLVQLSLRR